MIFVIVMAKVSVVPALAAVSLALLGALKWIHAGSTICISQCSPGPAVDHHRGALVDCHKNLSSRVNVVVQRPSVRAAGEAASAHRSSYLRVPVTKPRLNFAAANLDRILVGDCVALWIPGAASCGTVKPDVERSTQLWVRVALPYLRCVGGALNRLLDGA